MHTPAAYLKKLEQRLAAFPEEAMLLSELDGYLAGVLVCPELILPSEWLPGIWGGEDEDGAPVFDSADEMQELVGLVMKHYNAISRALHRQGRFAPLYDVDPRHDEVLWELWIGGFERAMALRPQSWAMILDSDDEDVVAAMAGLLALVAISEGESELAEEDRHALTEDAPDLIPLWVDALNAWRLEQGIGEAPSRAVPKTKIGRNDPCPCGSGKKYKKCCGLN
jgi:uncharacterized protein